MYSMELLSCLRTTEPLFRTYEPSDYRTLITESCKSRHRTYEPSDCRTFGMKNPLFRTHEPSDYGTFGLESSHPYILGTRAAAVANDCLFFQRCHARKQRLHCYRSIHSHTRVQHHTQCCCKVRKPVDCCECELHVYRSSVPHPG